MEVLGVASSVAGLLSLAGQCISGAQSLRSFYLDIVSASTTVDTFVKDINGLLRTLNDVNDLLHRIEGHGGQRADEIALSSLQLQLEDCNRAIVSWLHAAHSHKPTGGKGARTWFRKFWIAVNKDATRNLRADMHKAKLDIAVALATLNVAFSLQLTKATNTIGNEVHETHTDARVILNQSACTKEALLRLETVSAAMSDDIGSMRSLMSAWSSASSRSLHVVSSVSPSSTSKKWRCDCWRSIEALFSTPKTLQGGTIVQLCGFCGHSFLEESARGDARQIRDEHLRSSHMLVKCFGSSEVYVDLELFHTHLRAAHNAVLGHWTAVLEQACLIMSDSSIPSAHYQAMVSREGLSPEEETTEFEEPETATVENLMSSSWDAHLLGEFISSRDRINRWMLHMLGSDNAQFERYRLVYAELNGDAPYFTGPLWNRMVLKHWFLDEAAIGFDLHATVTGDFDGDVKFVNSSLYLFARPSTASDQDARAEPGLSPRDQNATGPWQSANSRAAQARGVLQSRPSQRSAAPKFSIGGSSADSMDSIDGVLDRHTSRNELAVFSGSTFRRVQFESLPAGSRPAVFDSEGSDTDVSESAIEYDDESSDWEDSDNEQQSPAPVLLRRVGLLPQGHLKQNLSGDSEIDASAKQSGRINKRRESEPVISPHPSRRHLLSVELATTLRGSLLLARQERIRGAAVLRRRHSSSDVTPHVQHAQPELQSCLLSKSRHNDCFSARFEVDYHQKGW